MKVEINKIKIDTDRQRKEMGSIEDMADSLKRFGQLQNIVIDSDYKLIAGERRTRAAMLLGWTTIDAKFKNQVSALEAEEMELEENLQRKELSWDETVNAKARIHSLKQQIHGGQSTQGRPSAGQAGGWTVRDTAAMLGESVGGVSQDIALANLMKLVPEIAAQPTKKAALRQMKVMQERMILNELAKRAAAKATGGDNVQLVNISCVDYIKTLADNSVDLVLTDPPYAIDIDQMGGVGWIWNKSVEEVFNDRSAETEKLKEIRYGVWKGVSGCDTFVQIIPDIARVLKDGSHCFVFCAMENFPLYADLMMANGLIVRSRPLIWLKNLQTFTSFFWKFAGKYEFILAAHKGDTGRILNTTSSDVLEYAAPRTRIHPTEKPVDLLEFLINISTSEGDVVLDPFGGSASTMRACRLTKRRGLSCEIDPEMVKKANGLLFAGSMP